MSPDSKVWLHDPGNAEVIHQVERFVFALSKELSVEKVILFGSQARGNAYDWSDIDLAVISNEFEGRSNAWRRKILTAVAIQAKTYSIQALGFSSREWSNANPSEFAGVIKECGITILESALDQHSKGL